MSDKICTYCRLIKPADTFRTCHITDICIDCYEKHIVINLTSYEPNEIQLNDKLIKSIKDKKVKYICIRYIIERKKIRREYIGRSFNLYSFISIFTDDMITLENLLDVFVAKKKDILKTIHKISPFIIHNKLCVDIRYCIMHFLL